MNAFAAAASSAFAANRCLRHVIGCSQRIWLLLLLLVAYYEYFIDSFTSLSRSIENVFAVCVGGIAGCLLAGAGKTQKKNAKLNHRIIAELAHAADINVPAKI